MIYVTRNYRMPLLEEINKFYNQGTSTKELAIDLFSDEKDYYIQANLPGYSKEEISISLDKDAIIITAEHDDKKNDLGNTYIKERFSGNFRRKIELTQECDVENIDAKLENGVLTIKIGKRAEAPKRKITID